MLLVHPLLASVVSAKEDKILLNGAVEEIKPSLSGFIQ